MAPAACPAGLLHVRPGGGMLRSFVSKWRTSFHFRLAIATGFAVALIVSLYCVVQYARHASFAESAQKARAEQYRVAMEAEQRLCPMEHHYHGADDWINNAYAYHNTSVWYGPTFCKQCGQRITPNH